MQPQRAVFRLVVDELPLPGEQSLVFKTLDGLARTETQIAGKNVHQFVLRVFCTIGRGFSGLSAVKPTGAMPTSDNSSWPALDPAIRAANLRIPARMHAHPE